MFYFGTADLINVWKNTHELTFPQFINEKESQENNSCQAN